MQAGANGRTQVPVPLDRLAAPVRVAAQMFWLPTPACGSGGFLAASDGLVVDAR